VEGYQLCACSYRIFCSRRIAGVNQQSNNAIMAVLCCFVKGSVQTLTEDENATAMIGERRGAGTKNEPHLSHATTARQTTIDLIFDETSPAMKKHCNRVN